MLPGDASPNSNTTRDGTKFKPEASYFSLESGKRTAFFVFNMENSYQCPEIAEAFFGNCSRPGAGGYDGAGSGAPWRVRRMASRARMDRRRPVSMTDRRSA